MHYSHENLGDNVLIIHKTNAKVQMLIRYCRLKFHYVKLFFMIYKMKFILKSSVS